MDGAEFVAHQLAAKGTRVLQTSATSYATLCRSSVGCGRILVRDLRDRVLIYKLFYQNVDVWSQRQHDRFLVLFEKL